LHRLAAADARRCARAGGGTGVSAQGRLPLQLRHLHGLAADGRVTNDGLCARRDPFGAALDALNGKTVHGAALSTRRITTTEEARECRVLFIGAESGVDLAATLSALKGRPVLTIAEDKNAMRQGAMIGLVSDGERVAFDINTAAARDGGLALSSKLLRLARQLHPAP